MKLRWLLASLFLVSCSEDNSDSLSASNTNFEDSAIRCPRFPEMEVTLLENGKTSMSNTDFSHRQLAVVAAQFSKAHPHARLRLHASSAVTKEKITEVVTLLGEAGLTDVIFSSNTVSPENSNKTRQGSIIDEFDTTGYQISLHNTPERTLYTIRDPEGKVLGEEITAEEFATRFPNIHHEVRDLGSVNFIEIHSHSSSSPIDDPKEREGFWGQLPPPNPEKTLIDLPPLPDLRTESQKARFREVTNQPGK